MDDEAFMEMQSTAAVAVATAAVTLYAEAHSDVAAAACADEMAPAVLAVLRDPDVDLHTVTINLGLMIGEFVDRLAGHDAVSATEWWTDWLANSS